MIKLKKHRWGIILFASILVFSIISFANADSGSGMSLNEWIVYLFCQDGSSCGSTYGSTSISEMVPQYDLINPDEIDASIVERNNRIEINEHLSWCVFESVKTDHYIGIGQKFAAEDGHKVLPFDAIDKRYAYRPATDSLDDSIYFISAGYMIRTPFGTAFCWQDGDIGLNSQLTEYYCQDIFEVDQCWINGPPWSNEAEPVVLQEGFILDIAIDVYQLQGPQKEIILVNSVMDSIVF